jgi:transposase
VLCFNPEYFAQKRYFAQRRVEHVHQFVAELNERLGNPRSRKEKANVVAEIDRRLRRDNLVQAFSVVVNEVEAGGRSRLVAEVKLDEDEWAKRRRYDGFTLLVAHPRLTNPARELARLYRAKDTVEKDFQTIKSVLKVRPVRHRETPKVQAHVSLCMLALLLERTLRKKLRSDTPERALEELEACRLNLYTAEDDPMPVYTITELTSEQERIVRSLRLKHVADDELLAERMTPRA